MSGLAWDQDDHNESLDVFLEHYPPSKTYSPAGGDGWIWVRSNRDRDVEIGSSKSVETACKVLDDLVERYNEIENNSKIPKIKSKTSGPSKKMLKESAQQQAEQQLRNLGKDWPCGKWLFFERVNFVDYVFSTLARSVIDGPLSKLPNAKCHTIKVATADSLAGELSSRGREPTHLICLYFDVVWNAQHAKEVLETVVKEHGQLPNSVKADLYTACGLDSNHPSKLRSTLYRPAEIFNPDQLKEWQSESRAQSKRKAEEVKEESETNKKKMISNGAAIPVKPEDFWRGSPNDDDEFEEINKAVKSSDTNGKSNGQVQKTKISSRGDSPSKNDKKGVAEDDSDTEDEDDLVSLKSPSKSISSLAKLEVKNEAKHESKQEAGKVNSAEKPALIKQTILVPTISTNKKRDRFGRSDF